MVVPPCPAVGFLALERSLLSAPLRSPPALVLLLHVRLQLDLADFPGVHDHLGPGVEDLDSLVFPVDGARRGPAKGTRASQGKGVPEVAVLCEESRWIGLARGVLKGSKFLLVETFYPAVARTCRRLARALR